MGNMLNPPRLIQTLRTNMSVQFQRAPNQAPLLRHLMQHKTIKGVPSSELLTTIPILSLGLARILPGPFGFIPVLDLAINPRLPRCRLNFVKPSKYGTTTIGFSVSSQAPSATVTFSLITRPNDPDAAAVVLARLQSVMGKSVATLLQDALAEVSTTLDVSENGRGGGVKIFLVKMVGVLFNRRSFINAQICSQLNYFLVFCTFTVNFLFSSPFSGSECFAARTAWPGNFSSCKPWAKAVWVWWGEGRHNILLELHFADFFR